MTRRRPLGAAVGSLVGTALVGASLVACRPQSPPADPSPRTQSPPNVLLLTSLPLIFGERFGLEGGGSPALSALEAKYRVVPIDVADRGSLAKGKVLLMAHPRAQPAENLVALDAWVRQGGRLLLLADPALDWPSELPLGDTLRPPPAFADTGLLAHWGLRLDAPDERGPTLRRFGEREILTGSPGALFGRCAISSDRFVARCRIGKGRAVVVADADFLNVGNFDGPTEGNLPALVAEVELLDSSGDSPRTNHNKLIHRGSTKNN